MDPTEGYQNNVQDFFQQSRINSLALPLQNSAHKYYDDQQIFKFYNDRNDPQMVFPPQQLKYPEQNQQQKQSNEQDNISNISSGNEIDHLLLDQQPSSLVNQLQPQHGSSIQLKQAIQQNQQKIQTSDLEKIITFIVQLSSSSFLNITQAITQQFPHFHRFAVVQVLMEKFSKLKKTKEELIKYCMRKAFKFILDLPKNQQSEGDKKQKYSFSKCKNKYVKRVSQQKSMNNKFLHQIFTASDFKRDYLLFLQHFQDIMMEDNSKKINYLASLLTTEKPNKNRNAQMVKRLPWTTPILNKVLLISKDLLKFADQTSS